MPRLPRLHIPGAFYHVILRGNHREALFGCAADRRRLNTIVAEVLPRTGARIHAFCWMTNHLHLLVQVADMPLGKLMQRIAVRYSKYRHRVLRTSGHLFERRYKARLVDADAYFLTLLRYIHLNPVKAHMVRRPEQYPWSSHRAYLELSTISWLTMDFALGLFSRSMVRARAAYRRFIFRCDPDDWLESNLNFTDPRILGSDTFIENLPAIPYTPRSPLTLSSLAEQVCRQHRISVATLRSRSRSRDLTPIRTRLALQAVDLRVATLAEVARFLHRDPSSLTKLLARHSTAANA